MSNEPCGTSTQRTREKTATCVGASQAHFKNIFCRRVRSHLAGQTSRVIVHLSASCALSSATSNITIRSR